MTEAPAGFPARYPALDAWRGVAAFSVLLWHRYYAESQLARGLWLGVQIFFVISGYCIAAAVDSARSRGLGFGGFMRRRVRRIGPPYLVSFLVYLLLCAVETPQGGSLERLKGEVLLTPARWLLNLTMLPWTRLAAGFVSGHPIDTPWHNPLLIVGVHWSLNYEEQFYLIGAALLLLWRRFPSWLLPALSALVLLALGYQLAFHALVSGFFVDYWLQFASGVAVYLRLVHVRSPRARFLFDGGLVLSLVISVSLALLNRESLLISAPLQPWAMQSACIVFALLLILFRGAPSPVNKVLRPITRAAGFAGGFSYSLYLIHQMLLASTDGLFRGLGSETGFPRTADVAQLSFVLASAWLYSRYFELPFLNQPLSTARAQTLGHSPSTQSA